MTSLLRARSKSRPGTMTSAKFVIAGGFGVGKTSFVGAVSDIPPLRTEEHLTDAASAVDDASMVEAKVSTTVAMDFGRIRVDDSLMVYLFGTPGQARFSFMWDTVSDGALGAVVLVDPRRLEDCYGAIDYFEQRAIPFVVAQNLFGGVLPYTQRELRELLTLNRDVGVTSVRAIDRDSVKAALLFLIDQRLARLE